MDHISTERKDKGFTLVELLIVIVILGILATVTVFAVRGITDKGQTNACETDKVTLQTAVETYFAQYGGSQIATGAYATAVATTSTSLQNGTTTAGTTQAQAIAVPAVNPAVTWSAGTRPAETLKNAGLIRSVPKNFFVTPAGALIATNSSCGTVDGAPVG